MPIRGWAIEMFCFLCYKLDTAFLDWLNAHSLLVSNLILKQQPREDKRFVTLGEDKGAVLPCY